MLSMTVRVTNLAATEDRLTAIKTALSDMTDVMTSLAATLVMFYQETVFASNGQALGEPWAPLQPKTVDEKNRHWPGRGILVRTGDMQRSFTSEIAPTRLFITNTSDHFLFHQLGTAGGPGRGHNIPARKMLGINDTVETIVRTEVELAVRAKIDAVRE